ncbi:MAG: carboxylating nicotinate-nucleotide diphosphorylase [Sphingomonadales bacterium]|nr:carboxylating nicotinate-nucleotide diphosphorylase [Sphingomonadales bacterium]
MQIDDYIRLALEEDVGDGDHTSLALLPTNLRRSARLHVKSTGILAGMELARKVFETIDPNIEFEPLLSDGTSVVGGEIAFQVRGTAHNILTAERLCLNIMQRMSSIATRTRQVVESIVHTHCKVLDTRKTTPLNRKIEKMAVAIGGGVNHRMGLYDAILIKDNHVDYAGSIQEALNRADQYLKQHSLHLPIVVEVRNLEELKQLLDSSKTADRVLLDNFHPYALLQAVETVARKIPTEASGGITPKNAVSYAETGVDFISMGCLTQNPPPFDLSLKAV